MKSKNILTPLLAFACLCMAAYISIGPAENTMPPPGSSAGLQARSDSLQAANSELDARLQALHRHTDSLEQTLNLKKLTIQQLKNKKHENTLRIDTLYSNGLYRFFAKLDTESKPVGH